MNAARLLLVQTSPAGAQQARAGVPHCGESVRRKAKDLRHLTYALGGAMV
ncbi:hypothetical protein Hsc_2687 [Herbaspirillum seropedicae]|nr:hypothetical protein Hsc_2687 [Herbaspirillum seropedicae]